MARRTTTGRSGTVCNEEQAVLLSHLLALKKPQLKEFLDRQDMKRSGSKAEIRDRLDAALVSGALTAEEVVQFLDEVTPWGKQHVFLYRGPTDSLAGWKSTESVERRLREHGQDHLLNSRLPLVLPEEMTLSSITHDGRRLRVTAIRKRQWSERRPDYDEARASDLGEPIHLRAFVERVTRGLVAFEWDLNANTAILQVSQVPSGIKYEDVAEEFSSLIAGWLDISRFRILDLRRAIRRLHEIEESGNGEARSHRINYRTLEGRRLEVISASPTCSVLGDPVIDSGLAAVRENGLGHLGNFYLCANGAAQCAAPHIVNGHSPPAAQEFHVIIIGYRNRVRLMTANDEDAVRHVLSRIRSYCA